MQLIKKQELNKIIKENFNCEFAIKHDGLYLIEIIASCKSWKQNLKKLRSFFKDDDLTIKIDEIEFPKLNGKRGLFDGEVAWNGNNLNGFFKTNIFVVNLKRGDHTIQFLNNQKPYLQSIKILKAENVEKITYIPTENNPAQDGDRRQWMNIILVDLPLKNLLIKAKANKHSRDSDDIKLIIDNKIQHNTESKLHKYWYWRGRALSGEEKEFNKEVNLPKGLHYIELWADRMPFLYRVEMELGNMDVEQDRKIIQQYDMYKGVGGKENYNRFDNEIKEAVDFWNNVFAKQEYPPKELLDYNLVKAMIYKESRIGYYKSEYYKAYPDVMQVGDTNNPALNSLRGVSGYDANEFVSKNKKDHISYNFPEEWLPVKVENPKESIFWGVRWLYNKAQKYYGAGVDYNNPPFDREWKPWEQAIIDYNGSPKKYEYQKEIWEIYKNGVDPDGNILWKKNDSGFSLIKMLIVIGLLISSSLIWLYFLVKVNNLIDNCVCAETAVLSEISRNTQYGEFNYSAEEHELIRAIFLRDLEQYKKDKYHYGDVFKNTIDECQKSNCDLEYIITGYYDDLVKYTRSNK
ncbi:hypothetical protein KKE88_00065, partial [Patescibacteria group bacterium]|nr:hypothetical protein [Patescibacteria group bacterium]